MRLSPTFRSISVRLSLLLSLTAISNQGAHAQATLDTTFGSGGIVRTQPASVAGSNRVFDAAVDSSGRLVVVGRAAGQGDNTSLVRWNASGALDTSFGNGGKVYLDISGIKRTDGANAVALDSSGRIWCAGYFATASNNTTQAYIARVSSNGQLDTSFGTGGITRFNPLSTGTGYTYVNTVALRPGGGAVFGGYTYESGTPDVRSFLIAVNANGTPDTSFGTQGIVRFDPIPGGSSQVCRVCESDGKWLVAGNFEQLYPGQTYLARFNADGTFDTTFANQGFNLDIRAPDWTSSNVSGLTVHNNSIYIAGHFESEGSFVAKLNSNGAVDTNYGESGYISFTFSPGAQDINLRANDIAIDSYGRVVLAGNYSWQGTDASSRPIGFAAARFTTRGNRDVSFGDFGFVSFETATGGTKYDEANAIALDSQRIYLAGNSEVATATSQFTVAALKVNELKTSASVKADENFQTERTLAIAMLGLSFTISLDEPVAMDLKIQYSTRNGSALAGSDYVATSGEVTIPTGQTSAQVFVPILDDTIVENTEQFYFTLTGISVGTLKTGASEAIGVIPDNDTPKAYDSEISTFINTPFRASQNNKRLPGIDENELPLTYSVVSQPQHGTVQVNSNSDDYLYTPTTGYFGTDSFTYRVNNGQMDSNVGTISITVREASSLVVTTLADTVANDNQTSLREAIANLSGQGETITFAPNLTGTIELTSNLSLYRSVTIEGPGADKITISRPSTGPQYGLITITSSGSFTIKKLKFAGGKAPAGSRGGAISNSTANLSIYDCVFDNNSASSGGAVAGAQRIENSSFRSNSAVFGAAVYNNESSSFINACYFGNNSASGSGGAIYAQTGKVTAQQSTFWNNSAMFGGAISTRIGEVKSCTFVSNKALGGDSSNPMSGGPSAGGAIYLIPTTGDNTVKLLSSNCLYSGNTSSGTHPTIHALTSTNGSYNLVDVSTGLSFYQTPQFIGLPPGLDPAGPKFNGGPTETIALIEGSGAIDSGFDSTESEYDQRGTGFPRIQGRTADIGAFEAAEFEYAPSNVNSGFNLQSRPYSSIELTTAYRDPNGANTILDARAFISDVLNTSKPYAALRYRDGRLYLMADNGKDYIGGYAPGSRNTIENSLFKLDCLGTKVTNSNGRDLVINWVVTPKSGLTGTKNVYGLVIDKTGLQAGWDKVGTWSIQSGNFAPEALSAGVSEINSSPGVAREVEATYRDINGASDIREARVFIASTLSTQVPFVVARYFQGKLYLCADDGKTFLGGFAPGSANKISNSYGTLDCAKTSIVSKDSQLIVRWNITPKTSFTGLKKFYALVTDHALLESGWQQSSTWNITTNNVAPFVSGITPDTSSSQIETALNLESKYFDYNGATDIEEARLLISKDLANVKPYIMARYFGGKLYLRSDEGTANLGGFAPGSANFIETAYGVLDCSKTTVTFENEILTVNWNIKPKAAFTGSKKMYLMVMDRAKVQDGWTYRGLWDINAAALKAPVTKPSSSANQG